MGTELWTLSELADLVADALSAGYDGQQSRRVREVPDVRAIRYYTTLGLLDRPAAMRGRTALYGRRHLWQLVAIKRLQADGRTLAEIQQQLTGVPDATLRALAAMPPDSFWRRRPAPPDPLKPATPTPLATEPAVPEAAPIGPAAGEPLAIRTAPPAPDGAAAPGPTGRSGSPEPDRQYQAITLFGGAIVLVPHRKPLSEREIATLRAAAVPLAAAVARLPKGRP
jgi:DNA-binding transcriptional MerR regulator